MSYETLPKAQNLLLGFGFLEGTTGNYSLQSTEVKEKSLQSTALEISSPIEAEDNNSRQSAGSDLQDSQPESYCYNDTTGFDDYDKIMQFTKIEVF